MNLAINRSVVRLAIFLLFCLSFTSSVTAENFNSRPPNATGQIPAFAEQTRAPKLDDKLTLSEAIIANGLRHPWGMAQLPDGGWLVTERPGNLRLVKATGEISKPIIGLPDVDARGQGGLLDIAIKEDFKNTHRIWWSYAEPRSNGRNATAVATGTLSEDMSKIAEVRVIFRQNPPCSPRFISARGWYLINRVPCLLQRVSALTRMLENLRRTRAHILGKSFAFIRMEDLHTTILKKQKSCRKSGLTDTVTFNQPPLTKLDDYGRLNMVRAVGMSLINPKHTKTMDGL